MLSFLLENKTLKQTVFKNTFWITVSSGICKAIRAVLVIYIARALGPENYGQFSFALAFVSLFVSFFDMGLSTIITREFSFKEEKKEFYSLLSLKIIFGLATTLIIFISSFFITNNLGIRAVIWVLTLFTFISQLPEVFYALFRARERMEYESFINVFQVIILAVFVFLVVYNSVSILNISYSYLFSSILALLVVFLFFHFKIFPVRLSFDYKIWKRFLLMSWPLALTSIFGMVYSFMDSTILGATGEVIQAGWYNAALRIINVVLLPAGIISMSFYPVLSRSHKGEGFLKVWDYQVETIMFLVVPIAVGGIVLATPLISFIYGPSYLPSVGAFQILMIMAAIAFIHNSFVQLLITAEQQVKTFIIAFSGAVINLASNIILIPRYSFYGAAASSLITYALMFILSFLFIYKFVSINPFGSKILKVGLETMISAGIMYLVISRLNLHVLFIVMIGFIVYLISFLSLKYSLK